MSAREAILAAHARGEIGREIALARLLLTGEVPAPGALPPELEALAETHRARLEPLAALARQGFSPTGADQLAATAALFDRLSRQAPEAAVAFYTLGDPALLDVATRELVAVVRAWTGVADRAVLDFGCGIGRVAIALAPEAAEVTGIDLSAGMIEAARARAEGAPNLRFAVSDGRVIPLPPASVDVVIAADCFPFLVEAGGAVLEGTLRECARVLRPGGDLLVFNWSYRGDDRADRDEAEQLGRASGFACIRNGERPFALWDGVGFHLRRA